jgi:hypothetical protein
MLVTVKSREIQRALLAEMRGDREAAARHFLAGAHLELVLAEDYQAAGESELALRSWLSAASCLWRGRRPLEAQPIFDQLHQTHPSHTAAIEQVRQELMQDYPPRP